MLSGSDDTCVIYIPLSECLALSLSSAANCSFLERMPWMLTHITWQQVMMVKELGFLRSVWVTQIGFLGSWRQLGPTLAVAEV